MFSGSGSRNSANGSSKPLAVFIFAFLAAFAVLLLPAPLRAQTDWRYSGHDPGAARYSYLKQIDTRNVTKLRVAWTFHTGDPADDVNSEGAPLVIDDVMYLDAGKEVFALDPETGKLLWKYETKGTQRRGLAYWPGDAQTAPRIFLGVSGRQMLALDAKTGQPAKDFGDGGFLTGCSPSSSPVIYKDLVITGENGVPMVRAWDAHDGKLVWTFYTKAQPGEPGHDTWKDTAWNVRGGTDVWSFMTLDAERGIVYVPIPPSGGPDFYGGVRLGDTLYADSVVAVDANTGKMIWYHQLVHHDLWDYDVASPPTLFDVRQGGNLVHGVAQFSKQGLLFLFDRFTGKPLFGMEERPVPQTSVAGDATSATQPFPLKPPPLAPMTFNRDQIYNLTPEHADYCRNLWDSNHMYNDGPFTVYSTDPDRMAMITPGREGSGNWSGTAFDPKLGYIFGTTDFNTGQIGRLEKSTPQPPYNIPYEKVFPNGPSRYQARFWEPSNGWSCLSPPWAELFAVNAKTGDVVWRVPFGTVDALAAKGFPNTGAPNTGSMVVTAGGIIFIGATNDNRFRAFDARSGKTLWIQKLEASAHTIPITYEGRDSKQYVVVEAFGGPGIVALDNYFDENPGDAIVAFALP